jgi:hypothetical protein
MDDKHTGEYASKKSGAKATGRQSAERHEEQWKPFEPTSERTADQDTSGVTFEQQLQRRMMSSFAAILDDVEHLFHERREAWANRLFPDGSGRATAQQEAPTEKEAAAAKSSGGAPPGGPPPGGNGSSGGNGASDGNGSPSAVVPASAKPADSSAAVSDPAKLAEDTNRLLNQEMKNWIAILEEIRPAFRARAQEWVGRTNVHASPKITVTRDKKADMKKEEEKPSEGTDSKSDGDGTTKTAKPANSTADYAAVATELGLILYASPELQRGVAPLAALAPGLMSVIDNGWNKESAKKAVIPGAIGAVSALVNSRLLR